MRLRAWCVTLCLLSGRAVAADSADLLRQTVARDWHVTVVDHDLANTIVPRVATADRPVTMADLSAGNAPACLQAVVAAFKAYPTGLVSSRVQQVALADMIHAWSIRIGGFHAPGLVAVNCESAAENGDFDTDSVHDELAALMLARGGLDEAAWQGFNPPGFRYGDVASYKDELRNPGSRDGDAALHRNGFVGSLGLTGIENDFQTYAERMFGHPAEFAALLRQQPAMRGKARLVMAFYVSQAPSLAGQFREEGLTAAAAE